MTCKTYLVSACLLGIPCQYDGRVAKRLLSQQEVSYLEAHIVPVCPEQLSGLPTPRKPVEIIGGDGNDVLNGHARVISQDGIDFTEHLITGAQIVLRTLEAKNASAFIAQHRSPSCSCSGIYDGTFCHILREGQGVCAALLNRAGIKLISVTSIHIDANAV